LWRTYGDISDKWDVMLAILDKQDGLEQYSGPDSWNDPDMLEVGNGGMTTEEYRAQISLLAVLNAPLIAGNDLRSMDSVTRELLVNPDVIAVDQDWSGTQGRRLTRSGDHEVWAKPMSNGSVAVVLFNRAFEDATIDVAIGQLGFPGSGFYELLDLWRRSESRVQGAISESVPGHGVRMFMVRPGGGQSGS
jgi:alpha-galactosidase